MAQFYLSATRKSSGKTTVAIGLCAALKAQGLTVQAFKKGPDYIDPMWLARASGRACWNLDFHTAGEHFNTQLFSEHAPWAGVSMVEGNMGLFDGLALDGRDSNAAMAKLLDLPVVLVVDCAGTSGGIAPLLTGYRHFDPKIRYAGVILNKLAGQRHESKIRSLVEHYTDFNIVGAIHRDSNIQMTERHLGLVPSNEISDEADQIISELARMARNSINIDQLSELPDSPDYPHKPVPQPMAAPAAPDSGLRVAVARDDAFGFYYPGDLQRFTQLGVEIVEFNATRDSALPKKIDGLFIGGGFPESRLDELAANTALREDIKRHIERGLPAYAECGGLMYLCRSMSLKNQTYPLCDVIPAEVTFHRRPQGRGYVSLQANHNHPWYTQRDTLPEFIHAHEFHYSSLTDIDLNQQFAYTVKRGTGIDGINDGIIVNNLVASYVHLRQTDLCSWVDDFVEFIQRYKSKQHL